MITKEEFAQRLTGREYTDEISRAEEAEAKASGLLVVFGASDDLMEFRGALRDEANAYEGATARISKEAKLHPDDLDEHEEFLKEHGLYDAFMARFGNEIKAAWCPHKEDPAAPKCSWLITTELPHATFDVMEDGDLYCRGIVINTKDLK